MKRSLLLSLVVTLLSLAAITAKAQTSPGVTPTLEKYPWTDKELLEPSVLAATIKKGTSKPVILNIGVVEDIPGARHIGAANKEENLTKLKEAVAKTPKNTELIIYCGCCPFTRCPNAQPAFNTLKKMGFNNVKLLNLSTNLKTDWIAKGYPVVKE
ncbi:MAG: rhodanese-like domain-containing protein [Bacteroidota bacterium]